MGAPGMPPLSPMAAGMLGVLMLAVFALVIGAVTMWRRGERRKPALMLVCAAVLFVNVLIWTV